MATDTTQTPVFLDPPQKSGKPLEEKVVRAYYEKLQCYQVFEPRAIGTRGAVSIILKPGAEPVLLCIDEYDEWRQQHRDELKNTVFLFEKPKFESIGYVPYMRDAEKRVLDDSKLDDMDRAFVQGHEQMEGAIRHNLYGYHTYTGYPDFFQPDLREVIHLVATVVTREQLDTIKRIYVTTVDNGYDPKTNMHKAVTTCYVC